MYENIHIPVQNLRRPVYIKPGGLCRIYFTRIQDVETFPAIDPQSGVIKSAIGIKTGATLYVVEATEKDRTFTETLKTGAAGDYMDMQVITNLAGNSITNTLGLAAMMNQQFVLIVYDRDGIQRIIGNEDAGATLIFNYTSGDQGSSRYRNLTWKYQHSLPAPIYMGGTVIMDNANYVFTALTLVIRFRVGAAGAPMSEGDTVYTNPLLADSNFIVLADGIAIHQLGDLPDNRYCAKSHASSTIFFNGGVTDGEVLEIYKF